MAQNDEFLKAARESANQGIAADFWAFVKRNKKWWLVPLVAVFLLLGVLILLSGTGAAPFIYTLF
jgi:hypothetical protein